jgi:hypothetical protein
MKKTKIRLNSIARLNTLFLISVVSILLSILLTAVYAIPSGPTVTILSNETKNATPGTLVNSSINGTISPGGYIFTTNLQSVQQNVRWKAYVGNVTGTLTLDDASDNTIYQWTLTSVAGEVYATRSSGIINWTGINCTWISDGRYNATDGLDNSNRTPEHDENVALSHTGLDDNITATFTNTNHSSVVIGSQIIGKNECFTVQTYQRDASQVFADSDNANFTQIILYDGAFNSTDGNVVYATIMQEDITGYDSTETFDFQIILPENGATGFSSSTGYYFYVELT